MDFVSTIAEDTSKSINKVIGEHPEEVQSRTVIIIRKPNMNKLIGCS